MDHLACEVDDIFARGSLKEKIPKYYEHAPLPKEQSELEVGNNNDIWPLTVFLTPPSSPDTSRTYEDILNNKQSESDDILSRASRTKDLKSMLIRDCMWNGESPKKGRNFEKLRPLTKTPPLIDCNLRIMYVDPSEIWPFNVSEQPKAGKITCSTGNNSDSIDEEVEVDVVGLEGNQKVEERDKNMKEVKSESATKCDTARSSCIAMKTTPQTENTDHDYSCNLRSGTKRRRSSNSDSDKENCTEQKTRVLSGDESDPDCEILGRATHNVLERKRRNELKLRFQYLRDAIPDICGNDRAPKVSILQKAYNYILHLQAEERSLLQLIRIQKNRKEQLLKKVLEMQNDNLSF